MCAIKIIYSLSIYPDQDVEILKTISKENGRYILKEMVTLCRILNIKVLDLHLNIFLGAMKMVKLYYCANCKKIHENNDICATCEGGKLKELKKGTSVNVIGTKIKGIVYRIRKGEIELAIVRPETKERYLKVFKPEEVRKVL